MAFKVLYRKKNGVIMDSQRQRKSKVEIKYRSDVNIDDKMFAKTKLKLVGLHYERVCPQGGSLLLSVDTFRVWIFVSVSDKQEVKYALSVLLY